MSIYYSDPECYESGASMANIDKTNGYDEDTGIENYGTCWCQFGDKVNIDDAECCITTWAKDCNEQGTNDTITTTNEPDECKTTGGNQPNNTCVFPFWFKENTYETCITVEDDTPWCSTEVDSNGHHVKSK